ncbi:MAG: hypothetical protein LBB93_02675 [Elusimicrobiota bacterium]|jgi:uncharacterized protein YacL|nr:hypothetical protein [Elusimicrobiota bacterium]
MLQKILTFIRSLFAKPAQNRFIADITLLEDGRISNILRSEFIQMELLIPQFIIDEMKKSCGSRNLIKRNRSRRGIEVVSQLKTLPLATIIDKDSKEKESTAKLLSLCKTLKARLLTVDFKTTRTALASGVSTLNLNDIAKSFKPIYLPGETLTIFLAKEGAQNNQAVGYLEDGAMIIVEDAKRFIGKKAEIYIASVVQSSSGRIVFGKITENCLEQFISETYKKSANRR